MMQPSVVMLMREFYPLTGGYQNQALRLAREMVQRSMRVTVVTQRHGTLPRFEVHEQIPIHRVFAFRAGTLAAFSYLVSSLFWMARHRSQFQLIHANRSSSGLVAGLCGFLLGKRVLYKLTRGDEIDVKGLGATPYGRLKAFCLRRTVDRFVAITEGIARDLRRLGIPERKLARIPNGIETPVGTPGGDGAAVRPRLGWPLDAVVVTFVGRLVHAKGVDWLLEIWRRVAAEQHGARLLVVGDGEERSNLEAQARALGISDTVAFVGKQRDVAELLYATDVFVLPSRQEGISNALMEAMSLGLAVVAADDTLGGNREVIRDEADGLLVPLGDGELFARRILELVRDPERRRAIGSRAREKIREEFSIASVADKYCALYRELLADAASP